MALLYAVAVGTAEQADGPPGMDDGASRDIVSLRLGCPRPLPANQSSCMVHATRSNDRTTPSYSYRVLPVALLCAPFAPSLLAIRPVCPFAAAAALLAFSIFFLLSAVAFFSLPALMASWRAAALASGRCDRRSLITSREAPTMPRCCLTVRRVRFLATSCKTCRDQHQLPGDFGDILRESSPINPSTVHSNATS